MAPSTLATAASVVPLRWRFALWLSLWLMLLYFAIVLPLDRAWPAINDWRVAMPLIGLSAPFTYVVTRFVLLRGPRGASRAKNITLLCGVVLCGFLAADVGFTVYVRQNPTFLFTENDAAAYRTSDAQVWDREIHADLYMPPGKIYWLYKPLQSKSGSAFGEHYYPALLRHPVLRDSVLERHPITFTIDQYGLRNTDPPESARLFALGDSFTVGFHTTQDSTFVARMRASLREPVYNLGVTGTSPVQQVLLFEDLLRSHPDRFRPSRLLWVLFEGNDLEESWVDTLSATPSRGMDELFAGTLVGGLTRIPVVLREESLIRHVTRRNVAFTNTFVRSAATNHNELDGETIAHPLYRSSRFGPRLFRQEYLDRSTQPAPYVRDHPNVFHMTNAFRRMRALADAGKFDVTVVMVPTDVRLYKDDFDDFPPVSEVPHVIRLVEQLTRDQKFDWLDLYEEMRPFATQAMLYYRDDTHWNLEGNRVAADLIAQHLRAVDKNAFRR